MSEQSKSIDYCQLLQKIEAWSVKLGFQQTGVSDIELSEHDRYLNEWIAAGFHGDIVYIVKHGCKRSQTEQLFEHTCLSNYMAAYPSSFAKTWATEFMAVMIASYTAHGTVSHKPRQSRIFLPGIR